MIDSSYSQTKTTENTGDNRRSQSVTVVFNTNGRQTAQRTMEIPQGVDPASIDFSIEDAASNRRAVTPNVVVYDRKTRTVTVDLTAVPDKKRNMLRARSKGNKVNELSLEQDQKATK